jgi:dTDP-4-dehydrorhamnose reductase
MGKILLTGGSGLLGTDLKKYFDCIAPSSKELDVTNPATFKAYKTQNVTLIIHCAAYTDVAKAEVEPAKCLDINVIGTIRLLNDFYMVPFVFISSEYAKHPVNTYGKSKQLAEEVVKASASPYLIIRTLFKPRPYPWDRAFIDQITQGDYADVIAQLIAKEIKLWNKKDREEMYVGTGRKSMYELALKTRPDVKPNSIKDIKGVKIPRDYV